MRTYDDSFSGVRIYPGKGKIYVRGDSKVFRFQNGKSESLFLQRKNPRRIAWTVLYRRQHRKGISEEVAKKRTRRTVKAQRGIVGASLDVIKEKRSQRPEARNAARAAAIKESKEKKAASAAAKKAEKAKSAAAAKGSAARGQVSKQGAKGLPPRSPRLPAKRLSLMNPKFLRERESAVLVSFRPVLLQSRVHGMP
uniref:Large ribosomal subunit protein eL24-related N-terminal domain-containing protein n=1 Tax=Bionectria ochroleuca TaxID=29856 RepID=A0A8H7NJW1_BIOOC